MLDLFYVVLTCIFIFVYAWSFYNLPILVAGIRNLRKTKQKIQRNSAERQDLPIISIVVPVKSEEKVIGRLLDAMSRLNYPEDKRELIIVEDGSTDRTLDVCKRYAERGGLNMTILHKPLSDGKPSALNYGVMHATGEIIGIFDADNVPASDALMNVCRYFEDPTVAAVQGRTFSINSEENMLTKFVSNEETVWYETYLRGKDVLDLFVHLRGSCQFIRRDILGKVKGFDEEILSEDMEISARFTEKGYKIRYAPDVRSWQESPADLVGLFRQRSRWFRGTMEVAFKYGRLMAKPGRRSLDAEATLLGPFVLIASLVTYFAGFYGVFASSPPVLLLQLLMQFTAVTATFMVFVCGLALVYSSRPRRLRSVLWLPFIYFYWSLQAFVAFYAVLLIVLRRPGRWVKTQKTGAVRAGDSELQKVCE